MWLAQASTTQQIQSSCCTHPFFPVLQTPKSLHQIGCIGRPEDVPDISCSSHNIRVTKIGGIGCSFGLTETGSIRCPPDTLQIGLTDTAADIAGSPGMGGPLRTGD
jgi:hypothetical protein